MGFCDASRRSLRRPPGAGRAGARGYTLVELLAVIVILGALAASAVPRYADLAEVAHRNQVAMTAQTFGSAVFLANAACFTLNYAGRDNLSIFGAGNLDFNANCFPSATGGSNNLGVSNARCVQIWNGVLQPSPTISPLAADTTDYRGQGAGTICTYTYRDDDDTVRRFTYNAANGQIAVINP